MMGALELRIELGRLVWASAALAGAELSVESGATKNQKLAKF